MEMVRSVTVAVVKPTSSALSSYLPSGTAPKRYCPVLPVTSVCVKPVSTLRTETDTPGRTPPCASDTMPAMTPRSPWAEAVAARPSARRSTRNWNVRRIAVLLTVVFLQTKEPYRVALQDAIAVRGRQLELVDHGARVLDVLRVEAVGADDDAIGADEIEEKAESFRMIGEVVVMEPPHVRLVRTLRFRPVAAHMILEVLESSRDVGKRAARMRQHDLEPWKLVQRTGADEFGREDRVREAVVETRVRRPLPEQVRVQVVKENRVAERLDARQQRRELRLEQVIAVVDGIRQVNGAQARLARHAVQFLQRRVGVANRQIDRGDVAIGKCRVRLDARVIDNLRETLALLRCDDLPRHATVERQDVHLHAVLVHPFAALIDVELHRER